MLHGVFQHEIGTSPKRTFVPPVLTHPLERRICPTSLMSLRTLGIG